MTTSPDNSTSSKEPRYIIGVGASAGGLGALQPLVRGLSPDLGVSVVIVMHFDPDKKCNLAAILQQWTKMAVHEVAGEVRMQPNAIYVIPPGCNLTAKDSILSLSNLEAKRVDRAPIDYFFETLATARGEHAIGIILSGSGSDGVSGARAIKAQGGIMIAQDPEEAEMAMMPLSVIKAGFVDLVLRVNDLLRKLCQITQVTPENVLPDFEELSEPDQATIQKILAQLKMGNDHDFVNYRSSTLLRRIRRRLHLLDLDSLSAYYDLLRKEPKENAFLFEDLLITVTDFFRDTEVYDQLRTEVLPILFEGKTGSDTIRVWSAGCSTGEEAYSLAILLEECADGLSDPPEILVFASDIHSRALQSAREGLYPASIEARVSKERLKRFFVREGDGYRVTRGLRDRIVFAPHSMLRDPPFSRLNLICCRNVLIYLKREVQRKLLEIFHYALRPGGFLVLGSAESIDNREAFRPFHSETNIHRRHNVASSSPKLLTAMADVRGGQRFDRAGGASGIMEPGVSYGRLHQMVLEQYGPPSILVNAEHHIVHFSEQANRYLFQPPGEPTNNVFKRIREELRVELRTALFASVRERKDIPGRPVLMEIGGEKREVVLRVNQPDDAKVEGYFLVWFDERAVGGHGRPADGGGAERSGNREMEKELEETRSRLQGVIEEYETSQEKMRFSNEELQSINEELRSTMEELETGREELLSVNEELSRVNAENTSKMEELRRLTSDLNNFLVATDIATIFLDAQLHIMRFTPQAMRLFNIRPDDLGRSITDFTHVIDYDGLEADARSVLETLERIEREVRNREQEWFQLRLLPYRTAENQIKGVVVTLHNICRIKRAEAEAREHGQQLEKLAATLEQRVAEATQRTRKLASSLTLAEQGERERIAQMLHDDLQQQLCGLQMLIHLEQESGGLKPHVADGLSKVLRESIELTRRLTVDLSPPVLEKEGLAAGLRYLRRQMLTQHGVEVHLSDDRGFPIQRKDVRVLLFQLIRDLLFNAVQHSGVEEVSIYLRQVDDFLSIVVEDNGCGFDTGILEDKSEGIRGAGLRNMTDRLTLIGGSVRIDSAPGSGCRISMKIPNKIETTSEEHR